MSVEVFINDSGRAKCTFWADGSPLQLDVIALFEDGLLEAAAEGRLEAEELANWCTRFRAAAEALEACSIKEIR